MEEIELDKSPSSALLEDVFEQVELLEKSDILKTNNSSGFLEDIALEEANSVLGNKKLQKNQTKIDKSNSSIVDVVESLIHKGLSDSSDEEDNKYFEYSKYNECGRNLKNLLKQKTASNNFDYVASSTDVKKKPTDSIELLKLDLKKLKEGNGGGKTDLLVDPILGMRIINPLVSSTVLKEKMTDRIAIGTQIIRKFLDSPSSKESNWVTGGAIVNKFNKTSQKGNQYCVWTLTDLNGDIKTVSVFLFGSAYKEHWKTSVGTVVGILNPTVMESKERSEATLKVDNAQKILVMGMSKDYGICKSKRKNGENCFSVVNTSKCDFCTYHMKKEYNKACRRSDLQPPKIGRSLDNLRAKVLGKNQVFYGGKTFTANQIIGKKSSKQREKDEDRLRKLSQRTPLTLSQSQTNKDKSILSRLNGGPEVPVVGLKADTFSLESQKKDLVDLNFTVSNKDRMAAKANALKYVRIHGPIKKTQDDGKVKRTPEQISSLKRKLISENEETRKKFKGDGDGPASLKVDPSKEKLERNGITEKFLKLMNCQVRNKDILKLAESEEREKYFDKLEIREKMENKMASTFKVECKAVRCLKCNYKSFSASDLCKKEKHPLRVVNAIKRFWKCGQCSARTVCLELIPLHSCKTCGSSKWERASMMPEKKDTNLTHEPLSLRGHEEKFIGSTVKNASLNLLVPEEAS